MSQPADAFPPLPHIPDPHTPLVDDPAFTFPASCAGGGGMAGLRVWRTADGGHLALVTEKGLGVSITNAAEEITAALNARFRGSLVILEHWLPGDGADHDRLDQVLVPPGRAPRWRPVWPVPPANPDHAAHREWMRTCGRTLLTAPTI